MIHMKEECLKLLCHAAENCSKSKGESNATTDDVKKLLQIYFGNIMEVGTQIDSEVYITSFSKALNSFQMWNIYADDEKGCAIRFDDDFLISKMIIMILLKMQEEMFILFMKCNTMMSKKKK